MASSWRSDFSHQTACNRIEALRLIQLPVPIETCGQLARFRMEPACSIWTQLPHALGIFIHKNRGNPNFAPWLTAWVARKLAASSTRMMCAEMLWPSISFIKAAANALWILPIVSKVIISSSTSTSHWILLVSPEGSCWSLGRIVWNYKKSWRTSCQIKHAQDSHGKWKNIDKSCPGKVVLLGLTLACSMSK